MLQRIRSSWPVLASAALYQLAFPPFNLALLAFVALVPWLLFLRAATPKQSFRSGLVFGFLFWLAQMHWLLPFVGRWTGSWLLAAIPWLLAPLVGMWYFGLVGWLIQRSFERAKVRPAWLWTIPLAWCAIEVARTYMPELAFPWGLISTPLWWLPMLIQPAAMGGAFLVSAWVVLANVAIAEAYVGGRQRHTFRLALAVVGVALFSIAAYRTPIEGSRKVVSILQPGVDMAFDRGADAKLRRVLPDLLALALVQGADLAVMPEGLTAGGASLPPATPFPLPPPVPVLFGGQRGAGPVYQSAFAYDGKWSFADKTRLVIFGEYVPFRQALPFLQAFDLPSGDLTPANEVKSLEVNGIRVGPILCFEGVFPNVAEAHGRHGAQLLAQMAIDDWYMGSGAPDQLFAGAVFRAVENGTPLVRAAPLGISAAIDARGNIVARAPLGETRALRAELTVPSAPGGFRYRGAFNWACAAGLVLLLAPQGFRWRHPA